MNASATHLSELLKQLFDLYVQIPGAVKAVLEEPDNSDTIAGLTERFKQRFVGHIELAINEEHYKASQSLNQLNDVLKLRKVESFLGKGTWRQAVKVGDMGAANIVKGIHQIRKDYGENELGLRASKSVVEAYIQGMFE